MTGIAHQPVPIQARSVTDLIGNTPLLALRRVAEHVAPVQVLAKAEWYNPGGSVKDRAALGMIRDGERRGLLTPDKTLLDATSGNTGIAYAMIAAERGYRVKLCLPKNASVERKQTLLAYGAELVLTDPGEGTDGAQRRVKADGGGRAGPVLLPRPVQQRRQLAAHYDGTGGRSGSRPAGSVTHFVAGLGTTGTFMGTTRRLKEYDAGDPVHQHAAGRAAARAGGDEAHGDGARAGHLRPVAGRRRGGGRHGRRPRGRAAAGADRGAAGRPVGRGEPGGGRAAGERLKADGRDDAVVVTIFCDSAAKYLNDRWWAEVPVHHEAENWP